MFMVGLDIITRIYFTSITSIIAIPTGIKIFNWIFTLWSSTLYYSIPILFVNGFLFSFTFGGFTGIILANCLIDTLLHDSYFVVSHFHYVLSLGAVYAIFSSFYNYYILFSSYYVVVDLFGRISFIWFFLSSNIIFFTMHSLGLIGCSRRIFDYQLIFFRFHWFITFGFIGIIISLVMFVLSFIIPLFFSHLVFSPKSLYRFAHCVSNIAVSSSFSSCAVSSIFFVSASYSYSTSSSAGLSPSSINSSSSTNMVYVAIPFHNLILRKLLIWFSDFKHSHSFKLFPLDSIYFNPISNVCVIVFRIPESSLGSFLRFIDSPQFVSNRRLNIITGSTFKFIASKFNYFPRSVWIRLYF